jgi:phage terminase large subunit-like protein
MKPTKEMLQSQPFRYAQDVLDGKIVTGRKIKLAVERFFTWIENAEKQGYTLDHDSGMRAVNFFPMLLNHTKGKMAGQNFKLAPFQAFTIYNVFGWKDQEGSRRINTVYDKRAKKNGKSAEMAGVALYGMSFDQEAEAEIYIGATKEDQAKICWNQARSFVDGPHANPTLRNLGFRCKQKEIWCDITNSVLRPLGGDSKTQDGINSHIAIIDEYHAHRDDSVKENLESSSVQRRQPITWHITTAGADKSGVCKLYEDVCIDVLLGIKEDDNLWIMMHDLDDGDDWEDETTWQKANPLLGQGLSIDNLRKEYQKAVNQPSKAPNFKTKHLNMWVDAMQTWIADETWMQNKDKVRLANFIKYGCAGGMDLSTTTDLTSIAFVSNPDDKGIRDVFVLNFCPSDTIDKRSKEDRVPYRFWKDKNYKTHLDFTDFDGELYSEDPSGKLKLLIATEGNVVDYEVMERYTRAYHFLFLSKWLEYDRYNSSQIVTRLTETGVEMHPFAQTINHFSFPTKEFERLAHSGKIRHGGNPILQWCLTGAGVIQTTNEDIRISKKHSTKRIDPIIASIMALAGTLTQKEEKEKSKYADPDAEVYV